MKSHNRLLTRPWMLLALVVVLLISHGFAFYFLKRVALPAVVVSGLVVLILIKHLGLIGPLYAQLRRRFGHRSE